MISNILVAVDGSKNSLRCVQEAIRIAGDKGKVTLLHVVSKLPDIPIDEPLAEYRERMINQGKAYFAEARKIAYKGRKELGEEILFGVPRNDIAYFANHQGYDLIVVGRRGRTSARERFLGSVSSATILKSKIPVVVVK